MKIISVVGARPNFMKIAPFCHAIQRYNMRIKTTDSTINLMKNGGMTPIALLGMRLFIE